MGISDGTLIKIAKILNVSCAIALIAIAIYRFATLKSDIKLMDAIWTFYWMF